RPDHLRAEADVALEPVAAEVEPAVAQAQRLVDVLLVELEGQRRAARDDLERVDLELDPARREVRVDGLRGTRDDLALDAEDELVADRVGGAGGIGGPLGVDDELADPAPVAKVDEDQPAVVAAPRRPAGECDPAADVLLPHLAAHQVAPLHRDSPLPSARRRRGAGSGFTRHRNPRGTPSRFPLQVSLSLKNAPMVTTSCRNCDSARARTWPQSPGSTAVIRACRGGAPARRRRGRWWSRRRSSGARRGASPA